MVRFPYRLMGVIGLLMLSTAVASAHVVVKLNQVAIGTLQTYTMGVPNEMNMDTVSLRLLIPTGLKEVVPTVEPGWTITTKKTGDGDEAVVTEIDWTGGSVPVGERDDFTFSAQAPASSTTLMWKVYQTYKDGSLVSWDQDPATIKAGEEGYPYSATKVINDLTATSSIGMSPADTSDKTARGLGGAAIVLSLLGLAAALRKR